MFFIEAKRPYINHGDEYFIDFLGITEKQFYAARKRKGNLAKRCVYTNEPLLVYVQVAEMGQRMNASAQP